MAPAKALSAVAAFGNMLCHPNNTPAASNGTIADAFNATQPGSFGFNGTRGGIFLGIRNAAGAVAASAASSTSSFSSYSTRQIVGWVFATVAMLAILGCGVWAVFAYSGSVRDANRRHVAARVARRNQSHSHRRHGSRHGQRLADDSRSVSPNAGSAGSNSSGSFETISLEDMLYQGAAPGTYLSSPPHAHMASDLPQLQAVRPGTPLRASVFFRLADRLHGRGDAPEREAGQPQAAHDSRVWAMP